jgi:hypothetical protein
LLLLLLLLLMLLLMMLMPVPALQVPGALASLGASLVACAAAP